MRGLMACDAGTQASALGMLQLTGGGYDTHSGDSDAPG